MTKRGLYQINVIPKKRLQYVAVGLILASILFATCATVFVGVYSYISTYLGDSEDTLILTQSGTGNFIATRYISTQVAKSAEYISGVTLISPETLTPCMIEEETCFIRGIDCTKFYTVEIFTVQSGRMLTDTDIYGAFLGNRAAKRLHISVGDSFIIYSSLRDVTIQVVAIGIYSSEDVALNDEILVPLYTGQVLSGNYPNQVTYIRIKYNQSLISRSTLENFLISKHDLTVQLNSNETGTPIMGAQIDIYDISGKFIRMGFTDSLGESSFILDFGNYTIVAKYNQKQINRSIFLERDTKIILKIPLPSRPYTLSVKVLGENQEGIPFKTVVAWKGSEIIQMRQTNLMGETNFSLPDATYQFSTLFWNNFTQESVEFRQTANPSHNESLIFWFRSFKLGVRTSDPNAGSFLNTAVTINIRNGTTIRSGMTGSLGYTEFEDLTPSTYNISVLYGAIRKYQIIELRSDQTINFEFLPRFDLKIQVFNDSNLLPIKNAHVRLYDSLNTLYESYTNENGTLNFIVRLGTCNITTQTGIFVKNRIIYLNSSRTEVFWMPPYNLTVILKNITGSLQNNINVSLISSSFNDSRLSDNGLAMFLVPPNRFRIILNCTNIYISQIHDIFEPHEPFSLIIPPYNLTIFIYNGTDNSLPPISGANISIFSNDTCITSAMVMAGRTSFLLDPGFYNVSVNVSNIFYYNTINFNQPYQNLIFYSYPFNVTLIIRNGTTSLPQPNLQIYLYNLQHILVAGPDFTDSRGQITFFSSPMTCNITINNSNYLIFKIKTLNTPNIIYTFDFPPYNLTVQVFNASNNLPLQNALVEILSAQDNASLISKTTSSEGSTQFALNPGEYYINLTYKSYNFIQFRKIVADPQIKYHIPPYKLTVRVVDYLNNPLEDANVSIIGENLAKTNASGYTTFYLDPHVYEVTASWGNYSDTKLIDMRVYQETFFIQIRLVEKVYLNISVYNAINGRFLTNASVRVFTFPGEFIILKQTDQNGFCQFFLSPQVYNLSVVYEKSHQYQLINLTTDTSVIFSIIPLYSLTVFTFDDSVIHFTAHVRVQIYELGGQLLFNKDTNDLGQAQFNLQYGTYNITLQKGEETKWEIQDISQSEFLSFHMAPYKVTVTVINSTTLTPIPNALITFYTPMGIKVGSNETNTSGVREFLMNSGQYVIYLNISKNSWTKELDLRHSNSSVQITFSVSGKVSSRIDIGDPAEYSASLIQQTLGLTESVVYVLAIILTVLISFSIMNVVSSSVSETRKYIEIIRALGASKGQIYYLINIRIILISIISGVVGGALGILFGSLISILVLEVSLYQIVAGQLFLSLLSLSVGITLVIGLISSNITLYRLLKLPIAVAIKEILPQPV